jgi:hypothetical protein
MSRTIIRAALALIAALALVIGCSDASRPPLGPNEDLAEDVVERALSDVPFGTHFIAVLEGSQVVPPTDTEGRGAAFFSVRDYIDDAGNVYPSEMRFYVIAARMAPVTEVQIHLGVRGTNGPVVVSLLVPNQVPTPEYFSIEGILKDDDISEIPLIGFDGTVTALASWMRRGEAYIDLHTLRFPDGEIRGQVYPFVIPPPPPPPPPTIFHATLSGANVVPPVNTTARGSARFELTAAGVGLFFRLQATQIERVTAAHVRLGREGTNGPVVAVLLGPPIRGSDPLALTPPEIDPTPMIVVQGTLTDDDIRPIPRIGFDGSLAALVKWMRDGAAYVTVRTVAYPRGEIRGQLRPAPWPCPSTDCETGG